MRKIPAKDLKAPEPFDSDLSKRKRGESWEDYWDRMMEVDYRESQRESKRQLEEDRRERELLEVKRIQDEIRAERQKALKKRLAEAKRRALAASKPAAPKKPTKRGTK